VGLFAQGGHEAGHVVGARDPVFAFDADEEAEGGIAMEFLEAGIEGDVTASDGEEEGAPEGEEGIVVATFASSGGKGIEEGLIGDGFEEGAEGLQRGGIFEGVPGEEGFGDGDFHGRNSGEKGEGKGDALYYATDTREGRELVEKSKKRASGRCFHADCACLLGEDFFAPSDDRHCPSVPDIATASCVRHWN
jgi:hypothetical protein